MSKKPAKKSRAKKTTKKPKRTPAPDANQRAKPMLDQIARRTGT